MDTLYLWVKAFHIIAVISWMAGLLYLPRLFVYHAQCSADSEQARTFLIMERRLLKAIMTPAMIVAWIFGLTLVFVFESVSLTSDGWFHVKGALVICLTVFHFWLGKLASEFNRNDNKHGARFYRWINEVPTVLMICIVILVIVRPF